jgi:prepilin-type N-terminal cleavage/methylation domain-containing protein
MILNSKTTEKGFTIVELMMVVAIIGLIISIAGPNYKKIIARARTIEAKVQLAAVFSAEKNFAAENGSYTTCLAAIGYKPDTSSRYYSVGFHDFDPPLPVCGTNGWKGPLTLPAWQPSGPYAEDQKCNLTSYSPVPGNPCPIGAGSTYFKGTMTAIPGAKIADGTDVEPLNTELYTGSFDIRAAGVISSDPPDPADPYDIWQITDKREIIQIKSGI